MTLDLPFELFVAIRYLVGRRRQAFISLISLISVLGIGVGVMALLIALALMTGLHEELRDRLIGSTAHILVLKAGGMSHSEADLQRLRGLPGVVGAAPVILGWGLIYRSTHENAPVRIQGILPQYETSVTNVGQSMQAGSLDALANPSEGTAGIVVGRDLADKLSVSVGDVVRLVTAEEPLTPFGMTQRNRQFTVVGVFKLGVPDLDEGYAFIHMSAARTLLSRAAPDVIELHVRDPFEARTIADSIPGQLGSEYVARDWTDTNASLFAALWLDKMAVSIAIGLIVLVAALNIIASLILLVLEKRRDIAILKTMGSSPGSIRRIFMLQGLIIGVIGTCGGGTMAAALIYVLDHFRLVQVPQDVYQVAYMPFRLEPVDGVVVITAAILLSFLATVYPSREASRLNPAQALRSS